MKRVDYSTCRSLTDFKEITLNELGAAHGYEYVEYLRVLPKYLANCSSYRELGTNQGGSAAIAVLENLDYYELVDISFSNFNQSRHLFDSYFISNQLTVILHENSSLDINTEVTTDFLLVDSVHKYKHIMQEVQKFAPLTKKYIMFHDTNNIPQVRRAVDDFLRNTKCWEEIEHYPVNAGYTVLKRIQ